MNNPKSSNSALFVLGQVISILFGFKIFYENFPDDIMWVIIGLGLVIFGFFSITNHFKK